MFLCVHDLQQTFIAMIGGVPMLSITLFTSPLSAGKGGEVDGVWLAGKAGVGSGLQDGFVP